MERGDVHVTVAMFHDDVEVARVLDDAKPAKRTELAIQEQSINKMSFK